ncbi:MAG: SurA N-terminal domain-containing protein, partial [Victivallales bacterium]|nr:SurA N-terminal domain-containing protein [Victivallales bacterium]
MVIRKMNNMFTRHGRWIFALITLFIIVSFVGFLTPGFSSMLSFGGRTNKSVGIAFGKNISIDEIRDQATRYALVIALISGTDPGNARVLEGAEQNAFASICLLRAAQQCGVVVSDDEIAAFIEKLPRFQNAERQFDRNKFNQFVNKELNPRALKVSTLELAVREFLTQQKLSEQVIGETITTPAEVKAFFNMLLEKYDVSVMEFKAADYMSKIKLTEEAVSKFFAAHRKAYIIPDRYDILTVEFGYDDFMKKAAAAVTETAIKNYYDQNNAGFTRQEKDKVVTLPLAKVRDTIRRQLMAEQAQTLAEDAAQQFALDAYNATQSQKEAEKIFRDMAKTNALAVSDCGWLDRNSAQLGQYRMEPKVLTEIEGIYIKNPVSQPVSGDKCTFVIFLKEHQTARPAELSEVKDKVRQDMQRQ